MTTTQNKNEGLSKCCNYPPLLTDTGDYRCTKCSMPFIPSKPQEEEKPLCTLCGEPMPEGEEMFKYHGYSGDCPKPPLQKKDCECGEPHISSRICHHKNTPCHVIVSGKQCATISEDSLQASEQGKPDEICRECFGDQKCKTHSSPESSWKEEDREIAEHYLLEDMVKSLEGSTLEWQIKTIKSFIQSRIDEAYEKGHTDGMELRKDYTEFNEDMEKKIRHEEQSRIRKMIEGMKDNKFEYHGEMKSTHHQVGYNQALSDLLTSIETDE